MAYWDDTTEEIGRRLNSIEARLARLESVLINTDNKIPYRSDEKKETTALLLDSGSADDEEKGLESRVGRFGLAWLGNIVLLIGIIFLSQYLMNLGQRIFCIILGYIASASIFFLANRLKKINSYLSFMFKINALILLYYITLRLHYFSGSPLLADKTISVILLVSIVALVVYLSIRNRSQAYAALSVIFALATAITSETTHFMLLSVSLTSAGTVYFYYRFKWESLLIVTIILSYFTFFLWLVGNPLWVTR
jgi:hypothetical protein